MPYASGSEVKLINTCSSFAEKNFVGELPHFFMAHEKGANCHQAIRKPAFPAAAPVVSTLTPASNFMDVFSSFWSRVREAKTPTWLAAIYRPANGLTDLGMS